MSSTKTIHVAVEQTVPADSFGLPTLVGKPVLIFTTTYIYFGFLQALNGDILALTNAHIVYETGNFSRKSFVDAQKLPTPTCFLSLGHIESIMETAMVPVA